MKKIILSTLTALTLITIGFSGCSNSEPKVQNKEYINQGELSKAPNWVLMPSYEGKIAAAGSAQQNSANDISFQRNTAMADARNNLVKTTEIIVKNMFKTFKNQTGNKSGTFDSVSESVSKQVANKTVLGSEVKSVWISPKGTMFVLMVTDPKNVINSISNNSSLKNDKALWQQFQAKKAQEDLSKELENSYISVRSN